MTKALVLDIDLHYGDGTEDILGEEEWVQILNPGAYSRNEYLGQVVAGLETVMGLHGVRLIAHPQATWGVITGNPIHSASAVVVPPVRGNGSKTISISA